MLMVSNYVLNGIGEVSRTLGRHHQHVDVHSNGGIVTFTDMVVKRHLQDLVGRGLVLLRRLTTRGHFAG